AVARVRGPAGDLLALVASDSFVVAGRRFTIAGGTRVDPERLAALSSDSSIQVQLLLPDAPLAPALKLVDSVELPLLAESPARVAPGRQPSAAVRFMVTHDRSALAELRRRLDIWFAAALGVTLLMSLAL